MESRARVAVVFVSRRTGEHGVEYDRMSERMVELAREQPGFVDMVSVRDPVTREGITVAWFEDQESVLAWKAHPEHVDAQRRGSTDFYEMYDVTVGEIIRRYHFEKESR